MIGLWLVERALCAFSKIWPVSYLFDNGDWVLAQIILPMYRQHHANLLRGLSCPGHTADSSSIKKVLKNIYPNTQEKRFSP